jgi:quercetin dioxygenase-like cupin family protein
MTAESSRYFRDVQSLVEYDAFDMRGVDVIQGTHLSCSLATFESGQTHAAHTHRSSDQLFVVLSGCGTFTVGGESRQLGPGGVVLAPAGTHHGVVADAGERLAVLVATAPLPVAQQTLSREPEELKMPEPIAPPTLDGVGEDDIPGAALAAKILVTEGDRIMLEIPGTDEPLKVVPTPTPADRLAPGPVRVIVETATRMLNRTMGTARAVKTRGGEPHRFTGVVVNVDAERQRVLVDAGFPVVVRDLGGKAAASLSEGAGVTFDVEGPTRAVLLG